MRDLSLAIIILAFVIFCGPMLLLWGVVIGLTLIPVIVVAVLGAIIFFGVRGIIRGSKKSKIPSNAKRKEKVITRENVPFGVIAFSTVVAVLVTFVLGAWMFLCAPAWLLMVVIVGGIGKACCSGGGQ